MTTVTSLYNCPCSGAFPIGGQAQNYANGYAGVASVGAIGPPGMQTPVQFRLFESASFSQQPQVAVLPYSPSTIVGATPIYYNTNGVITPANNGNLGGNPNTWGPNNGGNPSGSPLTPDQIFDATYKYCTQAGGPCGNISDPDFYNCAKTCVSNHTNLQPPTSLATVAKPSSLAAVAKAPTPAYVDDGLHKFCTDEFGPCAYLPDGQYEPCVTNCIATSGGVNGGNNIGGNPNTWGPVNSNYPPGYYPTPPPYGFRANECGCARTAYSQLPPSGFLAWEPLIRRFNEPFNSLAGLTCQGRLW